MYKNVTELNGTSDLNSPNVFLVMSLYAVVLEVVN